MQSIRNIFSHIDQAISQFVDHIFPKDLRFRYIIALSATAGVLALGQIHTQSALTKQIDDIQKIRLTDRILSLNLRIKLALGRIPLTPTKALFEKELFDLREQSTEVQRLFGQLFSKWPQKSLQTLNKDQIWRDLQVAEEQLSYFQTNIDKVLVISDSSRSESITEIQQKILQDISSATSYLQKVSDIVANSNVLIEKKLLINMNNFQWSELYIVLLVLAILLVQGMYIFRPSIKSLYRALEARSDLLSRLGHEVRNPMNAIIGISDILLRQSQNQSFKQLLRRQKKASLGLLDLLNNLLKTAENDFSNVSLTHSFFSIRKLANDIIETYISMADDKNIKFIIDYDPRLRDLFYGDRIKLKEVLMNLVGNALKFTHKGHVTLTFKVLSQKATTSHVYFEISDTGIGIKQENLEQIFESFVQENSSIKRKYGGSGLGLSISKHFVNLMGGDLSVESSVDKGSRFFFELKTRTKGKPLIDDLSHFAQSWDKMYLVGLNPENQQGATAQLKSVDLEIVFSEELPTSFDSNCFYIINEPLIHDFETKFSHLKLQDFNNLIFLMDPSKIIDLDHSSIGDTHFIYRPFKSWDLIGISQFLQKSASNLPLSSEALGFENTSALIVDDSSDNRFIMRTFLEEMGIFVTEASGGQEGLKKFNEKTYDFVLLDIQMPDMDGYSVIRRIKAQDKKTPIIAVTAHETEVERQKIKNHKFHSHIIKPVNQALLKSHLKSLVPHKLSTKPKPQHQTKTLTPPTPSISPNTLSSIEEKIKAMAPKYLKARKEELAEMKSFAKENNYPPIQSIAHKMKGSAKTFGFEKLTEIGGELEVAAKNEDFSKVEALLHETENFIDQNQ